MIYISSRADRYLLEPLAELGDSDRYLVVLGDRRETFEAATQAFFRNIPIIHIQGGESTPYSKDDIYRDCITRMASLHFPAIEQAAQRIFQIQPGATVVSVGAIGAELATNLIPIAKEDLYFGWEEKTWLATWHPQPGEDVQELIDAFKEEGGKVIWTYPNKDPGYEEVLKKIDSTAYPELTMPIYLSLMHYVTAVVGNSSSGLIEAPSIGAQTINIGKRQIGRPQATSVTSIACRKAEIEAALHLTSYMPVYAKKNPYYKSGTIETILREIKTRYA